MAGKELEKPATNPQKSETPFEFFASICTVLVILLFIITFVFQNFEIPSSSMEKTLLIGDHVLVGREAFAPPTNWAPFIYYRNIRRGDIIVFYKPGEPNLFLVKRVVAIPGDRLHMEHGIVYLNGKPQNMPYATLPSDDGNPNDAYYPYRDDFPAVPPPPDSDVTATWAVNLPNYIHNGNLVVPPGDYFAMGDNRMVSLDSRYWGFVHRQDIIGRPLFVYWSFVTSEDQVNKTSFADRIGYMGHVVVHFFDQTRWRRTFHRIE
ncbi:MAG: signal peptidase I [Acidobacteriaceae bacterium]